jgi:hypothetical protein
MKKACKKARNMSTNTRMLFFLEKNTRKKTSMVKKNKKNKSKLSHKKLKKTQSLKLELGLMSN